MNTKIEKVRKILNENIERLGIENKKVQMIDKILHDLIIEEQFKKMQLNFKEAEIEENKNITISLDFPAAIIETTDWGTYINGKEFNKTITDKITEVIKKDKRYILNMQLDVCLIDPEKEEIKISGGDK